jgi:hypothetical protein
MSLEINFAISVKTDREITFLRNAFFNPNLTYALDFASCRKVEQYPCGLFSICCYGQQR